MNVDSENDQRVGKNVMMARQEPSTFMRFFEVLASKVEGKFSFDITRSLILLSSQWIAEGPSQQNIHDRYSTSTHLIMAAIYPVIRAMPDDGDRKAAEKEYKEIEDVMNTCDIVEISVVGGTNVKDINEFKLTTKVSELGDDGATCKTNLHEIRSNIVCKKDNYNDGVMAASENGYRRVNCTARRTYYRALKLAFMINYLDPLKMLEIDGIGPKSGDYDINRTTGGSNARRV